MFGEWDAVARKMKWWRDQYRSRTMVPGRQAQWDKLMLRTYTNDRLCDRCWNEDVRMRSISVLNEPLAGTRLSFARGVPSAEVRRYRTTQVINCHGCGDRAVWLQQDGDEPKLFVVSEG